MKDIKDIMKEMDKLAQKQVAVELSEEEKNELMSLLGSTDRNHGTIEPCCNVVPFCCTVDVPKGFTVDLTDAEEQEIDYVTCLTCCKDPDKAVWVEAPIANCPGSDPLRFKATPVRIVGGIQFIITGPEVKGCCHVEEGAATDGNVVCPTPTPGEGADICCIGSVCVDQVVAYVPGKPDEECKVIPCEKVGVCFEPVSTEDCNGNTIVKFTGKFILPTDCKHTICTQTPCPTCTPTPPPCTTHPPVDDVVAY